MQLGIIGFPLGHSFSPAYFAEKFRKEGIQGSYDRFPIETITQLPELLDKNPGLRGFNVTIPYKSAIIPYLDHIDRKAAAIGSVNCVRISDGSLTGYNTDCDGFMLSLQPLLKPQHNAALVLGCGGSSKAIIYVLQLLGIETTIVSRNPSHEQLSYAALSEEIVARHKIIVNTTPLGMLPDVASAPAIPYNYLTPEHLLYDLVYNPEVTSFLRSGAQSGAVIKNGLEMLHIQAEASWKIWNS